MGDSADSDNKERERVIRERAQLERLHFIRVAGESAKLASPPAAAPTDERPSDDEIMSLMRAFYGKPDALLVEWLASMRAVRESVMLSMGDA